MSALTAAQILAAAADPARLKREPLAVPELGGTVYLRELTGQEREEWGAMYNGDVRAKHRLAAATVWLSLVDEAGNRFYTDPADITKLAALPGRVIERMADVTLRLSGMKPDSVEEAKGN